MEENKNVNEVTENEEVQETVQLDPIKVQLTEVENRIAGCDPEDDFEALQKLLQLRSQLIAASKTDEPKVIAEETKPKKSGNGLPWAQLILGTAVGLAGAGVSLYGINTNREIAEMAYAEEKDMHLKNGTVWNRMLPKFFG